MTIADENARAPVDESNAEKLGCHTDITRRDFVGSALLGTGSVLLGMASPAALRTANAQTLPAPMTGLGPDWTGPGGIGDYARSNGNTLTNSLARNARKGLTQKYSAAATGNVRCSWRTGSADNRHRVSR